MNSKQPTCSLLIATYNWPEALEKCLQSAFAQSVLPDEIIIADDGSTAETKDLITRFASLSTIPIQHIWHPDKGFRLSEIRNKAIAAATFDYIIQIDGDIIMEQHFIQDHLSMATENAFICGSRVKLESQLSSQLFQQKTATLDKSKLPLGYVFNSFRIPFLGRFLADRYKRSKPTVLRGCNMSFWRKDLLAVNGYNSEITGWGREDAELAIRLINNGVKKRFLKFMGIAYHLYHREHDRSNDPQNKELLASAIKQQTTWIDNGIEKKHDTERRS